MVDAVEQSHLAKEQTLFSVASANSFLSCLIYFEVNQTLIDQNESINFSSELFQSCSTTNTNTNTNTNTKTLNESFIKEKLLNSENSSIIQNVFVLYGNRAVLIQAKCESMLSECESLVNAKLDSNGWLVRREIPYCQHSCKVGGSLGLCLVAEMSDTQLGLIDSDKYQAIKFVEAKTGLRLKKIKKSIYFSGLAFQFLLLNDILNDKAGLPQPQQTTTSIESSEIVAPSEPIPDNQQHKDQSDPSLAQQPVKIQEILAAATDPLVLDKKERHPSKEFQDWPVLYSQSSTKYNFKLTPKQHSSSLHFDYDVYVFQADLTDLNTDALVNASNPDLHPGYDGDGISRRIRERGGKQMQDACKSIIKTERSNCLLKDAEVVHTKAFGKLRSKYVLHSVAPTWSKYVLSLDSGNSQYERFEPLLEQTFVNILKLAHDSAKMKLTSMAFPVSASSSGGAFDVPLELFAHTLYTQLVEFKLSSTGISSDDSTSTPSLKTICITSIEPETVKTLCEIFSNYFESYSESSWAMPLSPMSRILQQAIENKPKPTKTAEQTTTNKEPTQITILQRKPATTDESSSSSSNNSKSPPNHHPSGKQRTISLNENTNSNQNIITKANNNNHDNHQVLLESSSSSTSSNRSLDSAIISSSSSNATIKNQRTADLLLYCCLFCQKESQQSLARCGHSHCKAFYCDHCIYKYLTKQNSKKCPSCHAEIDAHILAELKDSVNNRSSSSSSLSPTRINNNTNSSSHHHHHHNINHPNQQQQQQQHYYTNGQSIVRKHNSNSFSSSQQSSSHHNQQQQQSSSHISSHKPVTNGKNFLVTNNNNSYQITDGKIYVRKLDESCEGYENVKSLLVTFEVPDGIQNDNHPKPGLPYKGTSKRAYLPDIKEHIEILAFYEKALKTGMLFKVEWSRNFSDYRVLLNQDVLLKTKLFGGGRFGYPDANYIDDVIKMARNFK